MLFLALWDIIKLTKTLTVLRSQPNLLFMHIFVEDVASLSVFDDDDPGGRILDSEFFGGISDGLIVLNHFLYQLFSSLNRKWVYFAGNLRVVVFLVKEFHVVV